VIGPTRWAIKVMFGKKSVYDSYIMWENLMPLLFLTRQEARDSIEGRFGYMRGRLDLKREPHHWRMPIAVKVRVSLEEL